MSAGFGGLGRGIRSHENLTTPTAGFDFSTVRFRDILHEALIFIGSVVPCPAVPRGIFLPVENFRFRLLYHDVLWAERTSASSFYLGSYFGGGPHKNIFPAGVQRV